MLLLRAYPSFRSKTVEEGTGRVQDGCCKVAQWMQAGFSLTMCRG